MRKSSKSKEIQNTCKIIIAIIIIVIRVMYRFLGIPDSDKPNRKKSF